jgi:hypothetical protein
MTSPGNHESAGLLPLALEQSSSAKLSATGTVLNLHKRRAIRTGVACSAEKADVEHRPSQALGAPQSADQLLLSRVAPPSNHLGSRPWEVIVRAWTCYG